MKVSVSAAVAGGLLAALIRGVSRRRAGGICASCAWRRSSARSSTCRCTWAPPRDSSRRRGSTVEPHGRRRRQGRRAAPPPIRSTSRSRAPRCRSTSTTANRPKPRIFSALTDRGLVLRLAASRMRISTGRWSTGKTIMGWRPGMHAAALSRIRAEAGTASTPRRSTGSSPTSARGGREGAWISGTGDFAIFNEPALTKALEQAGALKRARLDRSPMSAAPDYTVFFAKSSWLEENPGGGAGLDQRPRPRPALDRDPANRRGAYCRGRNRALLPRPDAGGTTSPSSCATAGNSEPIWAESTVVSPEGLAMAQKIMVIGGG